MAMAQTTKQAKETTKAAKKTVDMAILSLICRRHHGD
jgi:hypothetical protein